MTRTLPRRAEGRQPRRARARAHRLSAASTSLVFFVTPGPSARAPPLVRQSCRCTAVCALFLLPRFPDCALTPRHATAFRREGDWPAPCARQPASREEDSWRPGALEGQRVQQAQTARKREEDLTVASQRRSPSTRCLHSTTAWSLRLIACLISVTAWAVGAAAAGPDLVPTSLVAPGSASAQQAISVTWTVQNQGSASAVGSWQDGLYLSATPTCCSGATALGAWPRGGPLAARASYTQVKNASVPDVPAGNYYLVVWADAGGVLGEDRDDNNQRAIPIRITAPDLTPTALTAPAAAPAGQPVSVSWTVKNQGTGATVGAWSDDLLLSATPTCCLGAISLMRTPHTALSAGAAYSQTRSVTLPRVAPGSYYLIVRADAAGVLHEADETNNERAIPITVTAPDLTPTALTFPGAAAAGHAISLSWTVQNRGTGPAVGSWTDKIYLSASQTCCSGASSLGAWVHASALGSGGSYTETRSVTIPNVAPGTYYVTVWTDASGQLSEAADGNNQLATPIAVTGGSTPPSTLAISSVNAGRHPVAGTSFAVIVQARDVAGAPRAVSSPTGVTLALKAGDGALGGTVAGTIPAGASQITIGGVTYTRAQSGVALTANRTSGDALTPGDSSPFTVDPGSTASYAVAVASVEPVGVTFAVSVTARDAFGNTVTTDSSTLVTLRSDSGHVAFDGNADGAFGDGSRRL